MTALWGGAYGQIQFDTIQCPKFAVFFTSRLIADMK
jgi:hypothetical protein